MSLGTAIRSASLVLILLLVAAGAMSNAAADAPKRPQRIVSMNLCTDELLMRMVDPTRIASISFLSQQPVNAPLGLSHIAASLNANHGLAEEVLMAKPDLIVAGTFSTTAATALLRRLGHPVVTFDPELSFDDMRANIRKMGEVVGEPERAAELIADFDRKLAELQSRIPPGPRPMFADIGVNNFVAGRDTLYAEVVHAGGYRTMGETLGFSGFRNVSLEQILLQQPSLISVATPWTDPPSLSTLALRHPALRKIVERTPQVVIPERFTTCGAPSVLGAVELLVEAREAQASGAAR